MPRLFDAYMMVDWSAASVPTRGKDSIWVGVLAQNAGSGFTFEAVNPATRLEAYDYILAQARELTPAGKRLLIGFDFSLGYPAGTAEAMGLDIETTEPWKAMHTWLASQLQDGSENANQRFEMAAQMNRHISGQAYPFWGTVPKYACATLLATKGGSSRPNTLPEFRATERFLREHNNGQPKSCWQLYGAGAVGSQSLMGIPHVYALRHTLPDARIWPFETGLKVMDKEALMDTRIIIAEIYPSLIEVTPSPGEVKDRAQVRAIARHYCDLDKTGKLGAAFGPPNSLDRREIRQAEVEEGWILGK